MVTYPIDLENSNWSTKKGSQNGSQSDLFDSEKGSKNLEKKFARRSEGEKASKNNTIITTTCMEQMKIIEL